MPADAIADSPLLYRCPMCKTAVEINEHYIGETIDCPSCKRPFEVTPPQALPIGIDSTDSGEPGSRAVSSEDVVSAESVEMVIHPVVFRRHFVGSMIAVVGCLVAIIGIAFALSGRPIGGLHSTVLLVTSGVVFLVAAFFLTKWYLQSRFQSLSLTNQRLVYTEGILHRRSSEVRHGDVRNVQVSQSLFERAFAFGDIAISSAGQDDMELIVNDIPRPQEVVNFIREHQ
ncbi:PH domain-containing protein [Roseiconus lacunae]|nr:PH domain-containing protein [Roseiconus lacunae]